VIIVVVILFVVLAAMLVLDGEQLDFLRLRGLALPERQPGEGIWVRLQIAEDVVSQSTDQDSCKDQGSDEVGIDLVRHFVEVLGVFSGWC
jgi:hypothetical protein